MSSTNVARVLVARLFVALALLVLAWWLGSLIDGWLAAAAAILPLTALAERLVYVAWKESRA